MLRHTVQGAMLKHKMADLCSCALLLEGKTNCILERFKAAFKTSNQRSSHTRHTLSSLLSGSTPPSHHIILSESLGHRHLPSGIS